MGRHKAGTDLPTSVLEHLLFGHTVIGVVSLFLLCALKLSSVLSVSIWHNASIATLLMLLRRPGVGLSLDLAFSLCPAV